MAATVSFEQLMTVFESVWFDSQEESDAAFSPSTGEFYFHSPYTDEDEIPEDIEDLIYLPHKDEFDLGQRLVHEFIGSEAPEHRQQVRAIFSRRGAYRRYKEFLHEKGLLDRWYAFEEERKKAAVLEWCAENGISVVRDDPGAGDS
jgi:hypothetical protein